MKQNDYAKTIITDNAAEIINNHNHVEIYVARYSDGREDQICCRIDDFIYVDFNIVELDNVREMWKKYLDNRDIDTFIHDFTDYVYNDYISDLIITCNEEINKYIADENNSVYMIHDDSNDDNDNIEIKAVIYINNCENDDFTEDDELNLQAREEMMDAEPDTEPDVITDDQLKMEAEALARHEAEQTSISIANYSRETGKTFFEIFK